MTFPWPQGLFVSLSKAVAVRASQPTWCAPETVRARLIQAIPGQNGPREDRWRQRKQVATAGRLAPCCVQRSTFLTEPESGAITPNPAL